MHRPLVILALCLPLPAVAQDVAPAQAQAQVQAPALSVELNGADTVDGACRLTFLVENTLGADLGQMALETVILTTDGIVERLTLFDFRDVPADRPRVRQFDLGGITCDAVGSVLINGVATCAGDGVDPAVCAAGLTVSTRVAGMEMLG